jgi:hypothetical protein
MSDSVGLKSFAKGQTTISKIQTFGQLYQYLQTLDGSKMMKFLQTTWKDRTHPIEPQESVFRLFAFLNMIPEFESYTICEGSFNNGEIRPMTNFHLFWNQKCKDKGSKSDLTLLNQGEIIATSSKNNEFKTNLSKLDISCLYDYYSEYYQSSGKQFRLCLVVADKNELYERVKQSDSSSELLRIRICHPRTLVFDHSDLCRWHRLFQELYQKKSIDQWTYSKKSWFQLHFHQALAVYKLDQWIQGSASGSALLGQKCRSGKSFIMLGAIYAHMRHHPEANYLLMTTVPASLLEFQRLLMEYQQFDGYQVVMLTRHTPVPSQQKRLIVIVTKQFLQSKEKPKVEWLSTLSFGLRLIDETHQGGTSELSQKILETYGGSSVFTLFVTASYLKPVVAYHIPERYQLKWDLEDERLCATISSESSRNRLISKHGDEVIPILSRYTYSEIETHYAKMPRLHILTWSLQSDVKRGLISLQEENMEKSTGLSLESLFLLEEVHKSDIFYFRDEPKLAQFCRSIFPSLQVSSDSIVSRSKITSTLFSRAYELTKVNRSRWLLHGALEEPLIVLCFLPCGIVNTPIDRLQEAFASFLQRHHFLSDFLVLCVNSKNHNSQDALQQVHDAVAKAKLQQKRGVLVLTGRQLSLAVSLPYCDLVLLMNSTQSFDFYMQSAYRCMTESPGKTIGIVVDVNFRRAVNMAVQMSSQLRPDVSVKSSIQYGIDQDLISINRDHYMQDQERTIDLIYDHWSSMAYQNLHFIMERWNIQATLPKEQLLLWTQLIQCNTSTKSNKQNIVELSGKDQDVSSGLIITSKTSKSGQKVEKTPCFAFQDILRHLVPLLCLLTIQYPCASFDQMIEVLLHTPALQLICLSQLQFRWSKQITHLETLRTLARAFNPDLEQTANLNILHLLLQMYTKYLKQHPEFISTVKRVKELFTASKQNPSELSKLLDTYLVPQDTEKKQHAEVSTPYSLRQEMLNSIPHTFWTQPRTVFEPCCGKGGFVLDVIHRFMEGLQSYEPNELKRYKLIVEKCIYFADINPVNIFITRLLLDPKETYPLNYYEGNTLELNIASTFYIKSFDLVVGNPPYNDASGNKGKGHTLWTRFVEHALNQWLKTKGYLLYVHPALWRQVDHPLLTLFKQYHLRYLSIHNEKDGLHTFKCNTRYDWYLLERIASTQEQTIIQDEERQVHRIILQDWKFIPNKWFSSIQSLLAHDSITPCTIINERSTYGADKPHMNRERQTTFLFPCVYSVNRQHMPTFFWSNTNNKGHFGIPKVIYGSGATGFLSDPNGDYGLTQWCSGIVCHPREHVKLLQVLNSDKFHQFKLALSVSKAEINTKNLRLLKEQWWNDSFWC